MLLPFYLWESATVQPVPVSSTSIAVIIVLALLVSVLGNLGWFAGNRVIGPSRAAIFINLIPVFGTALAIIFLGEELLQLDMGWSHWFRWSRTGCRWTGRSVERKLWEEFVSVMF